MGFVQFVAVLMLKLESWSVHTGLDFITPFTLIDQFHKSERKGEQLTLISGARRSARDWKAGSKLGE